MVFLHCTNFIELLKYEQKPNSMEKVVNKNVNMQTKREKNRSISNSWMESIEIYTIRCELPCKYTNIYYGMEWASTITIAYLDKIAGRRWFLSASRSHYTSKLVFVLYSRTLTHTHRCCPLHYICSICIAQSNIANDCHISVGNNFICVRHYILLLKHWYTFIHGVFLLFPGLSLILAQCVLSVCVCFQFIARELFIYLTHEHAFKFIFAVIFIYLKIMINNLWPLCIRTQYKYKHYSKYSYCLWLLVVWTVQFDWNWLW